MLCYAASASDGCRGAGRNDALPCRSNTRRYKPPLTHKRQISVNEWMSRSMSKRSFRHRMLRLLAATLLLSAFNSLHAAEAVDSGGAAGQCHLYVWLPSMGGISSTTSATVVRPSSGVTSSMRSTWHSWRAGVSQGQVVAVDRRGLSRPGADRTSSVGLPGGAINAGVDLDVSGWQRCVWRLPALIRDGQGDAGYSRRRALSHARYRCQPQHQRAAATESADSRSFGLDRVWDAVVGFREGGARQRLVTCRTTPMSAPATLN